MILEEVVKKIGNIKTSNDLIEIEKILRFFASNQRTIEIYDLCEKVIEKCVSFDNKKLLVNIYGYQISIIYNYKNKLCEVSRLIDKMFKISNEINYNEGLAWAYSYGWFIEKFKGNKKESIQALNKAINILEETTDFDEFIYYFIYYSYGVERWMENNDASSASIFEECSNYYNKQGYYRSLAQSLSMLVVIYLQTQNKHNALKVTKKLLKNVLVKNDIPSDIKGYANYFIGISYKLQSSLGIAECYFIEANRILKEVFKKSIYSVYYVPSLSHLAVIKVLKGEIEQALRLIREVEFLLQDDFVTKNLDSISKRQIKHSFNLVKFYTSSRLSDFDTKQHSSLIQEIYDGLESNYSNSIMLTEFLLNSKISYNKLKKIKKINNESIRRAIHILYYCIEKYNPVKESNDKDRLYRCIDVLQKNNVTEKMTFIEKVYIDSLIAQSLFSLKRYSEIYPLLRKYKNQLNRIEVLELRIFIEAFIQVGAYKNGDSLGPALQYISIKRCRQYNFSKMEKNLLIFLDLQKESFLKSN